MTASPDLKLVKDERNQEVLKLINSGNYPTIGELEKQSGISAYYLKKDYGAKAVRDRNPEKPKPEPKRPGRPPKMESQDPRTAPTSSRPAAAKPSPVLVFANAAIITGSGLALGGVGMSFNIQYWCTFGGTAFGVAGGAIDAVTIFLPANLQLRWGHIPFFALWLVCTGLSTIAAMGFSATNIGDSLQGRESVLQHRNAMTAQLASAQSERARIKDDRDPQSLEYQIQMARGRVAPKNLASSKDCTDVTVSGNACLELNQLRDAREAANRRIYLDAEIRTFSGQIAELPPVAGKDPGAEHISTLTAGIVRPEEVDNFRVVGFALMPSLAGFLLAFARTLLK